MVSRLFDYLNVQPEERTQVLLMLGAGFFMGIFLATYTVVAESLFLSTLGSELNKAFLLSGAFGILATLLYSAAQNKIKFSNLTTSTILFVVAATSFFYIGYHFGPEEYKKPIIFAMFCMTGPITAVLLLSYWGIFGRLFNFRQSKRIIGWIDTGQLVAIILANLLIPVTTGLFQETDNYLIVCALSIIVSAIYFIIIAYKFPLVKNDPSEFAKEVRKDSRVVNVIKDPYTKLLSLFLVISMVTLILGQFTFQELIKVQYPDQLDLTRFLAFFNASIFGLSFLMQTFVNDRIVSNYGIRVALFILPLVVGFFALSATVSGLVLGYSPESAPRTFIYFFLFVALLRLFNNMIRDSLENPMFKLLFIPLDSRSRFGIQSKVEGVINESGRFIAGALIFGFATLAYFQIIWMPIILCVLCGVYVIVIYKLYAGYKSKIRTKLEIAQSSLDTAEVGFGKITKKLEAQLSDQSPGTAVFSYKLLEKIDPQGASRWVNALMRNDREETREFAQRKMNELKGLSVSDRYIIRHDLAKEQAADKNLLSRGDLELLVSSGGDITKARISKLSRSHHAGDRQYAAELLMHTATDESSSFLIDLLHDQDTNVRNTAIKSSVKKSNPEVIRALIENLGEPAFSNRSAEALILIGGKALNVLDTSFYRSGQSAQALINIVQIIGQIGGQLARDILWNKIDYPDKVVVSKVLLGLGEAEFKASISQVSRIKYAIENDIGDVNWNLCAIQEMGNEGFAKEVKAALRSEISSDIEHVYMLMAMLYDSRSIQLVKENIESGTIEGTAFALELLDVFLSDQLKQRVIPMLDEISDHEKINRLEVFYPRVALDEKLVLKFLINRDFTQSNRWTKACVLRQIGEQDITDFSLDLIAQLFNPDQLIQEMAAWALYKVEPGAYESNTDRLGWEAKRRLDTVVKPSDSNHALLIFEKARFFGTMEIFMGTTGLALSFLADTAKELNLTPNQSLVIDEKTNSHFYIVYQGEVAFYQRGELKGNFTSGQFIGEMLAVPGFRNSNILVAKEGAILLQLGKDHLYDRMAENFKLASRVLDYV
ncbi:MAG: hypothetical protein SH819_14410 [Cytophagales bacterium]|nr:hypothetical protein [Cytophagales bacterium]